jgi:hypothetical protein
VFGAYDAAEKQFDYFFSENGLVAYKEGEIVAIQSLKKFLGDDQLKELINFLLHYIADLDIPIKRGTFIEFRNGMLNVSPIGRNCSQEERDDFEKFDLATGIRFEPQLSFFPCFPPVDIFVALRLHPPATTGLCLTNRWVEADCTTQLTQSRCFTWSLEGVRF